MKRGKPLTTCECVDHLFQEEPGVKRKTEMLQLNGCSEQ